MFFNGLEFTLDYFGLIRDNPINQRNPFQILFHFFTLKNKPEYYFNKRPIYNPYNFFLKLKSEQKL